jgi:hypothetical protein
MNDKPAEPASVRARSPSLTLREACHNDDDGRRCLVCSLRELCGNNERWFVGFRVH